MCNVASIRHVIFLVVVKRIKHISALLSVIIITKQSSAMLRSFQSVSRLVAGRGVAGSLLRPSIARIPTCCTSSMFQRALSTASFDPSKVRNVAIIAHVDHGKSRG